MPTAALLILSLLAASLAAQTPPCEARNDANTMISPGNTVFWLARPGTYAWQLTPNAGTVVLAVRLLTNNIVLRWAIYMTVEIWDDASGMPGTRLAGGSWKIDTTLGTDWQGANLDQPVVLNPGQPVWIVWIEPGASLIPVEPGGLALPAAELAWLGGAPTWVPASASALKVRLYCSYLDNQSATNYGQPCAASSGLLPTLFTNQVATVGNNSFALEGSGLPSNTPAILVLGQNPGFTATAFPGLPPSCLQNTDVFSSLVDMSGTGDVRGPDARGHVRFPLAVPANPILQNTFVAGQLAVFDAGLATPQPFAMSNALRVIVQ